METSGKRSCAISSSKIMCRELYLDLNTIGETVCLKFEACGHKAFNLCNRILTIQ